MSPTDLKCYKQVAAVIGEAYADHELQRVIDCEECGMDSDKYLGTSFIWEDTPQDYKFWDLINANKNPYEHGHEKPELPIYDTEVQGFTESPIKEKREYTYFVSYAYPKGFGNMDLIRDTEITEMSHILGIQELLEKEYGIKDCIVLNYHLLKVGRGE